MHWGWGSGGRCRHWARGWTWGGTGLSTGSGYGTAAAGIATADVVGVWSEGVEGSDGVDDKEEDERAGVVAVAAASEGTERGKVAAGSAAVAAGCEEIFGMMGRSTASRPLWSACIQIAVVVEAVVVAVVDVA